MKKLKGKKRVLEILETEWLKAEMARDKAAARLISKLIDQIEAKGVKK